VPGNVCCNCLVDHPAAAILNTAQARDLRVWLDEGGNSPLPSVPATRIAMAAMDRATDLCTRIHRTRRTKIQGSKAGALIVCGCRQAQVVKLEFGCWTMWEDCIGCGYRLPRLCWLPENQTAGLEDELATVFGHRRALRAAVGPAPITDLYDD